MINESLYRFIHKHKSKEVVIVSAGPSLNQVDKSHLKKFCDGKFVIAVKQAINILEICHLHIINDDNYEAYDYRKFQKQPKIVYVKSASRYKRIPKSAYDFIYRIPRYESSTSQSLAATLRFDDFTDLFSTDLRPLGPGIMYEICIFLPLYFASKKLYLFGWDIGILNDDTIIRFYQKTGFITRINGVIAGFNLQFYNRFYIHFENLVRFILFYGGVKLRINVPGIRKDEARFIANSTESLYDFYDRHGIDVTVFSRNSLLSERFKRDYL